MNNTPHALTRLFTLLLASLTILSISVAAAGTAAMFILSRFPMSFYARMSFPVLAASVVLLALVPVLLITAGVILLLVRRKKTGQP